MIVINGPDLQVQGTLGPATDWVRVKDHYSCQDLDQLLVEHGCISTRVFQDFFWLPGESAYETFFLPSWLSVFCQFNFGQPVLSTQVETTDCFSFVAYKSRPLRSIMLQQLSKLGLHTHRYTLTDNHASPDFAAQYFGNATQSVYNNTQDYNHYLAQQVYNPVAVALITEPVEPRWGATQTFTEKTIWPMLSLNLPIWLTDYRQAETWEKVGFDIFDDVIDHSYQYQLHPIKRIKQAINDNFALLQNLNLAVDTRCQLIDRLQQNRQKVLNNQVDQYRQQLLGKIGVSIPDKVIDVA